MNPQEARERVDSRATPLVPSEVAEQEAADQAEERRVAREDERWRKEQFQILGERRAIFDTECSPLPPWLFADERSQRKAEAMAREERPWDDYSPWQNEQLFR